MTDRHFQYIVDVLSLVTYRQSITLVSFTAALVADHIYRRQEIHLNHLDTGTLALFASSARNIEREPAGLETADFGIRSRLEQVADIIEHPCESGRIAPRSPSNRTLVNFDKLVNILNTNEFPVWKRLHLGIVELIFQHRHQSVVDKGRLAAATHSAYTD